MTDVLPVSLEPIPHPEPVEPSERVLASLVRVVEEAADEEPWCLIGSAALRLQGAPAWSPNLEFISTVPVVETLEEMLDVRAKWGQSTHLAAFRLQFMRHGSPVFIFANPVFHGPYESLAPREIPSLWDARVSHEVGGVRVLCTPPEWELLVAVVLTASTRVDALAAHLRRNGYDSRLLLRLMREGRVQPTTEDAVWQALENGRA